MKSNAQETRILRDRMAYADDAWDRSQAGGTADCSAAILVVTTSLDPSGNALAYPVTAQDYYPANPVEINGPEREGAGGDFAVDTSTVHYVLNIGTGLIPTGTYKIASGVGGRLCVQHDGSR